MSAFDFGNLSERRRIEKQAKQRKRIAIGLSIALVVAVIAACGALAVLHQSRHRSSPSSSSSSSSTSSKSSSASSSRSHSTDDMATYSKAIKVMCNPTDFKNECEKTLSKAAGDNDTVDPKRLLKASIKAVSDEIKKGFAQAAKQKSDDPIVKGAIKDCEELAGHAQSELKRTLSNVDVEDDLKGAYKWPELKNWMSAVMSYQQTCIDGFPEGETKKKLEEGMELSKKLTSNVLAIIGEASSILSGLGLSGVPKRRLLEQDGGTAAAAEDEKDELPEWMSHEERRQLKAGKAKREPNVVVAKDGSGVFKTISAALEAMPKDHKGRYVRTPVIIIV